MTPRSSFAAAPCRVRASHVHLAAVALLAVSAACAVASLATFEPGRRPFWLHCLGLALAATAPALWVLWRRSTVAATHLRMRVGLATAAAASALLAGLADDDLLLPSAFFCLLLALTIAPTPRPERARGAIADREPWRRGTWTARRRETERRADFASGMALLARVGALSMALPLAAGERFLLEPSMSRCAAKSGDGWEHWSLAAVIAYHPVWMAYAAFTLAAPLWYLAWRRWSPRYGRAVGIALSLASSLTPPIWAAYAVESTGYSLSGSWGVGLIPGALFALAFASAEAPRTRDALDTVQTWRFLRRRRKSSSAPPADAGACRATLRRCERHVSSSR